MDAEYMVKVIDHIYEMTKDDVVKMQKEKIEKLKWQILMIKEAIETWNIEYREGKVDFEIPEEITNVVWSDKE